MLKGSLLALAASLTAVTAQIKGFNYGSTFTDNSAKVQSDYEAEFRTAQTLIGTSGFASARLYTMIQAGTTNTPISAIPAAISTKTSLLLGMWASAGQDSFNNELAALSAAITQYGSAFTDLIVGISVGSEDLYRISPTGILNKSGVGAEPTTLVNYIQQVRNLISGTAASGASIGHVDTWNDWVNGSNSAVVQAVDWIGMDAYPYFETTLANSIQDSVTRFTDALSATRGASQGKPVWVTETGWPVSGPTENQAVPSTQNAQTYWDNVGCDILFGKVNTWWYTLQDAQPTTPSPSFGIVGSTLSTTPLYNLTCPSGSSGASASSSSAVAATSSVASASAPGSSIISSLSATATSLAPTTVPLPSGGEAQVTSSAAASVSAAAPTSAAASSAQASVGSSAAGSSPAGSAPVSSAPAQSTKSATGGATTAPAASATPSAPAEQDTTVVVTITTTYCPTTVSTTMSGSKTITNVVTLGTTTAVITTSNVGSSSTLATITKTVSPSAAPTGSSSSSNSCPADLSGTWEFPHGIIPVDSTQPSKAFGESYYGHFSPSVSTLFNFDIPTSYAGKTCSLVFLLPTQSQLETSSFTLSGSGGIDVKKLPSAASESVTFATVPAGTEFGSESSITPGNAYSIGSFACPSGQAIGFEVSATGSLDLNFFQDYNPSPIGLYITVC